MNKYFAVFVLVAFLVIGSILVYTKNNVKPTESDKISQELSKFANQQQQQAVPTQPAFTCDKMDKVTELKIEDLKTGEGAEVKSGDTVEVDYLGTFMDGTKFDSSYDRKETFETKIPGQVIEGWNEGILGMKVGGKRKLTIPPDKAYGEAGAPGAIPPNCSLIFEIELHAIK